MNQECKCRDTIKDAEIAHLVGCTCSCHEPSKEEKCEQCGHKLPHLENPDCYPGALRPSEDSWEKELNKLLDFSNAHNGCMGYLHDKKKCKAIKIKQLFREAITQSRSSLLEELRGKIEGMRLKDNETKYGFEAEECAGYNQCIDDILTKLK